MTAWWRAVVDRHPWHPAWVHLPLGLLIVTPVWDLLAAWRPGEPWPFVARAGLTAGLVAAAPTSLFGLVDLARLPEVRRVRDLALVHAGTMLLALVAFGVGLVLRVRGAGAVVAVADGVGAVLLVAGGAVGGELVYRHGAGRREGGSTDPGGEARRETGRGPSA